MHILQDLNPFVFILNPFISSAVVLKLRNNELKS
jgi:hypothetical protein